MIPKEYTPANASKHKPSRHLPCWQAFMPYSETITKNAAIIPPAATLNVMGT